MTLAEHCQRFEDMGSFLFCATGVSAEAWLCSVGISSAQFQMFCLLLIPSCGKEQGLPVSI